MKKPTPRPWYAYGGPYIWNTKNKLIIAETHAGKHQDFEVNAAHIVKCVNAHERLLGALKKLSKRPTDYFHSDDWDLILNAIGDL